MKLFTKIISCVMILCSSLSSAQSFKAGTNILQGGIGFYLDHKEYENTKILTPPLSFTYEIGISNKISLGFYYKLNAQESNQEAWAFSNVGNNIYIQNYYPNVIWTFKNSVSTISFRSSFHCFMSNKLDPYYGVMFGIKINHYTSTSTDPTFPTGETNSNPTERDFGLYLGARYYFMNHFGVYSEIDIGANIISIGIVGKF